MLRRFLLIGRRRRRWWRCRFETGTTRRRRPAVVVVVVLVAVFVGDPLRAGSGGSAGNFHHLVFVHGGRIQQVELVVWPKEVVVVDSSSSGGHFAAAMILSAGPRHLATALGLHGVPGIGEQQAPLAVTAPPSSPPSRRR